MAALAATLPPSQWIPEDDLLLKNAVEAGASLEALAKGAVRFSRKFTVRELRDRWHSLLYDPIVSAEASARMLDLELSAPNFWAKFDKFGVPKESSETSAKRKIESVRKLYYAMRKKVCAQLSNSPDLGFIGSPGAPEFLGYDGEPSGGNSAFGDSNWNGLGFVRKESYDGLRVEIPSLDGIIDENDIPKVATEGLGKLQEGGKVNEMAEHIMAESSAPFHAEDMPSPLPGMPLWETMEDVAAPEMPIRAAIEDGCHDEEESLVHQDDVDGGEINLSGLSIVHSGKLLEQGHGVDVINNPAAISGCDFEILSDSLLNLENEDVPLFMDIDGKDIKDSCTYDHVNTLLVTSPHDVQDDIHCVEEPKPPVSDTILQVPNEACPLKLEVISKFSVSLKSSQQTPFCAEDNAPSSISAPNSHAERGDGEIVCVLNTEDFDIPWNENILSAKEFSPPRKTTSMHLSSSIANQNDGSQELILMKKEDNPEQQLSAPQTLRHAIFPVTSPSNQLVKSGVKGNSICPSVFSQQAGMVHGDHSHCRSSQPTPTSVSGVTKAESLRACNTRDASSHAEGSSPVEDISVADADMSTIYDEEVESVDDIPCFSDIEALILEMDLSTDGSYSCVLGEVSKYQNDEARRKIIRLEQCARSSIQRAIASRGALAILYGRHSKHYIEKTEVMLGRATDDMDVDIDLSKEGPANKISRRQALIKMGGDGSFSLKNLGKVPVFLNGKELVTGQSMSLKPSSLIEIRGLALVFEVNSKSVRKYVANVTKAQRENNFKLEWPEEARKNIFLSFQPYARTKMEERKSYQSG